MIPSHVAFVSNIANLLANQGHQVVVIDNILRNDISNRLDVNKISKIVQVETSPIVSKKLLDQNVPLKFWRMKNEPEEQKEVMENLGNLFLDQCKFLILNSEIFKILENHEFDFGIHEVFDVCGIGIFEKLKIRKSVILSSTGSRDIVHEALGISRPLDDSSILSDYGSHVPIWGIRRNLKFHNAWRNFFEVQSKSLVPVFNFSESFEDFLRYSNLLFLNTHELTDSRKPWTRRLYEIGGISFKNPKVLDKEYSDLFSNNYFSSIILVSFGTTTPSFLMPQDYKKTFINVFKRFPSTLFIWKYEKDDDFSKELNDNQKNVILRKYVPQVDLLESGKISLFITHGGQNSLLESFHSKVRTLVVPLFGDQHRNAKIAMENGLGQVLRKEDLGSVEILEEAIRRGLETDERIDKNLQRVSLNLRNAKKASESLLINIIESTYTENRDPPNFRDFPKFYSSNFIILIIDFSVSLCLLIPFLIMLLKFHFRLI